MKEGTDTVIKKMDSLKIDVKISNPVVEMGQHTKTEKEKEKDSKFDDRIKRIIRLKP